MAIPYAIEVSDLKRSFGEIQALSGISFSLPPGTFLSIFGPNGAGKTTLLKILTTLIAPTSGTVRLMGLIRPQSDLIIRKNVGFVSHATCLYSDFSIAENLSFYARLYHIVPERDRVEEVLSIFDLKERAKQPVRTLSRGFQQRVALARALLHNPPILLLDEPFTGLDPQSRGKFCALLRKLHREDQKTIVMITHEIEQSFELSDLLMIQTNGKISASFHRTQMDLSDFLASYIDLTNRA